MIDSINLLGPTDKSSAPVTTQTGTLVFTKGWVSTSAQLPSWRSRPIGQPSCPLPSQLTASLPAALPSRPRRIRAVEVLRLSRLDEYLEYHPLSIEGLVTLRVAETYVTAIRWKMIDPTKQQEITLDTNPKQALSFQMLDVMQTPPDKCEVIAQITVLPGPAQCTWVMTVDGCPTHLTFRKI